MMGYICSPQPPPERLQVAEKMVKVLKLLEECKYNEIWDMYVHGHENFLNQPFTNGKYTLFLLSVVEQHLPLLELLFSGAKTRSLLAKQKDINGNNALHLAVLFGSTDIVKFLLEHGLDKEEKNNLEETPLVIAQSLENVEMIKLLGGEVIEKVEEKVEHKEEEIQKVSENGMLIEEHKILSERIKDTWSEIKVPQQPDEGMPRLLKDVSVIESDWDADIQSLSSEISEREQEDDELEPIIVKNFSTQPGVYSLYNS